jgi:hypothetical protein
MSCGRVCKTTPCSFPHCATSEQRESYREGYDDAEWDGAKQRERAERDANAARLRQPLDYDEGYSDGYDAALVAEDAAWQPFAVPALCVAAFAFGFIAAALLL